MQTMDKAVSSKESRYMSRVIRMVTKLRRTLSKAVLTKALETYVAVDSPVRAVMLDAVAKISEDVAMQVLALGTSTALRGGWGR